MVGTSATHTPPMVCMSKMNMYCILNIDMECRRRKAKVCDGEAHHYKPYTF